MSQTQSPTYPGRYVALVPCTNHIVQACMDGHSGGAGWSYEYDTAAKIAQYVKDVYGGVANPSQPPRLIGPHPIWPEP